MSSWGKIINMKTNKKPDVFKEGVEYIKNEDPRDVFEEELKELEVLMDKTFRMEVSLLIEESYNQYERTFAIVESVYGANGDLKYKGSTYNKTVNAKEMISFILNERTFYLNKYSDADKLHMMLYKFYKKYESYNNTMGVKPIGNKPLMEQIKIYILKLEQDRSFIIDGRVRDQEQEIKKVAFFNGRFQQPLTEETQPASYTLESVMARRFSNQQPSIPNGRVIMK